jgi:class 3 adenylate cyclase
MSTPKETKESAVEEEHQFCFMSVDMVGHTLLTSNLPHRAIYDLMNAFHEWIERAVLKEKGEVWSWAGDGALCAFGPGLPDATAKTLACVRAAMEILDSLSRFNERREETRKTPVRLRVACHLGYARDLPQRGKVFSDAVNFVVHLEHEATLENSISISAEVYRELPQRARSKFRPGASFSDVEIYSTANLRQLRNIRSREAARYKQAAGPLRQPKAASADLLSGSSQNCVYYLRELKPTGPWQDAVTGYEGFTDGPMIGSNDLIAFWNASNAFDYRVFEPGSYARPYSPVAGKDIITIGYNAITQDILDLLKQRTISSAKEPGCGFFCADNSRPRRWSYVSKNGFLPFSTVPPIEHWVEGAWGYAVFQHLLLDRSHTWFIFGNRGITTMFLGQAIGKSLGEELRDGFGNKNFAALYRIEYGQRPKALWVTGEQLNKLRDVILK